jgi:predicted ferric reductase
MQGQVPIWWVPDVLTVLAGVGLGIVIALEVAAESWGSLHSVGGIFSALGRFFGLTGTYLILVMLMLVSRMGWLERAVGHDKMVRWHRRIGPWPVVLITLHIVTITLGYAAVVKTGFLHQMWTFLANYPDMLMALAGFALLVMAAVTSVRMVRSKLKYETWWVVHLYTYLALALGFSHQITNGVIFLGHPLSRLFWLTLWAGVVGTVVTFRFLMPIVRNLRYRLKVVAVTSEAPGVYSVTMSGHHLDKLSVAGGQFFQWRFMAKDIWWHSHPYSLSALPRPPYIRVTVKDLGDHSRAVHGLKVGTRVLIEGPYGAFTRHARGTNKVALIGAGVGVTPLRALLEDFEEHVDVAVLLRASRLEDLVHRDEITGLVEKRGGGLHELIGPRQKVKLDAKHLRRLIPDLANRDVYVCGPDSFTEGIVAAARTIGVPDSRIHQEAFAF